MKRKATWIGLFPKSHTNTELLSGPGISWNLIRSWVSRATDDLVPWIKPSRFRMCQVDLFRGSAGTEQKKCARPPATTSRRGNHGSRFFATVLPRRLAGRLGSENEGVGGGAMP